MGGNTKSNVLTKGDLSPDDALVQIDEFEAEDKSEYSKEAIHQRGLGYRLLAVYTPGHTFCSVTYVEVFNVPATRCLGGFTYY